MFTFRGGHDVTQGDRVIWCRRREGRKWIGVFGIQCAVNHNSYSPRLSRVWSEVCCSLYRFAATFVGRSLLVVQKDSLYFCEPGRTMNRYLLRFQHLGYERE